MLYDNWLGDVAARFQQSFDRISTVYNFDLGDEFEVAVCEVLRELLPRRFGVCRGFVVGRNGERAGDDIIVFDAQRFPTLRALARDLSRKEGIPAEAVLAYIEAKHTLIVEGDDTSGQSLAKATRQAEAVKAIPRPPVDHREALIGLDLGPTFTVTVSSAYPSIRNPYYTAIWARHLKTTSKDTSYIAFSRRLMDMNLTRSELPDAIVAGSCIVLPATRTDTNIDVKPFLCRGTELVSISKEVAPWGIALAHLLWAIEWVRLGDLPLGTMIAEQLAAFSLVSSGTPPIRGTKLQ